MKISKKNDDNKQLQLLAVRHYEKFQNAMSAIADYEPFDDIPDDIINSMGEWGNPRISSHSYNDKEGVADDFEFHYPCGIVIYLGSVITEEEMERSNT